MRLTLISLLLLVTLGYSAKTPPPTLIKDVGLNLTYSYYGKNNLDGFEFFYDRFEQSHWKYKSYMGIGFEHQFRNGEFNCLGFRYSYGPIKPIHFGDNSALFPVVSLKASYYNNLGLDGINLKPEFGLLFHNGQERLINFKTHVSYSYDMGRRFYMFDFADGIGKDHDYFGHSSLNIRIGIAVNLTKLNDLDFGKAADATPRFAD